MSDDLMNPAHSPQSKTTKASDSKSGRRRRNYPLIVVLVAIAGFGFCMIYAMNDRTKKHRFVETEIKDGGDSQNIAASLIGKLPSPKIPSVKTESTKKTDEKKNKPDAKPQTQPTVIAPVPVAVDPAWEEWKRRQQQMFAEALASPLRANLTQQPNNAAGNGLAAAARERQTATTAATASKTGVVGGDRTAALDRGATGSIAGAVAPQTRYVLRTGAVIPAMLVGGINSDLPGQIIGQVSQNVYDTPTGKYLLIPQGSRLVGEYGSEVKWGQNRVFAVWQRIIFPDGKAIDLGAFPMSSGAGWAGAHDKVDNHWGRIFGTAFLMSLITAGVEYSQKDIYGSNNNNNSNDQSSQMSQTMSEALGQNLGQAMIELLRRNMDISPTLIIRPGYRLNVMLVKDLEFKRPYRAFDYAAKLSAAQ
jgi:type IV secretion system protein VirB10